MKKIFFTLLITLIYISSYAAPQSDNSTLLEEKSMQDNKTVDNATSSRVKKKPDFNKKKISLDRIEDKKWSLRIGYAYFFPQSEYASVFSNRLKIGGAYDVNKYLQIQAMLQYADGNDKFNINGVSTKFTGTMYNIGALVTGFYPIEMPVGELAPFASVGGVYTFGNLRMNTTTETKQNLSGGGILAQAGLQYNFHVFAFRVYGEYLYDFTPMKIPYISNLTGASVGAEVGVKF